MTPAQIETAIRERYNAVGDTFFTSTMVYDIIYQAQMQLANEAFCIEKTFSTTTTASTRTYAFPTNIMMISKIEYDGVKIYPVDVDDDPKSSTTEVSGKPTGYAIWGEEIILYPTPDDAKTLTIYGYVNPQAVSQNSTLEVPDEYHLDIIDFGLAIFYAKDGNLQMASYHRGLWEAAVRRAKKNTARKKRGDQFAVVRDQANMNPLVVGDVNG